MNGKTVSIRESLECAMAALVRIEHVLRITHLRVEQARQRCGLGQLLDPALAELDEIVTSLCVAKQHISIASHQISRVE